MPAGSSPSSDSVITTPVGCGHRVPGHRGRNGSAGQRAHTSSYKTVWFWEREGSTVITVRDAVLHTGELLRVSVLRVFAMKKKGQLRDGVEVLADTMLVIILR